jgi:RND family efflux transporter MFP subunit
MKYIITTVWILTLSLAMVSCGGGAAQKKGSLGDKKAALAKLQIEQKTLNDKISGLEDEIALLDPASAKEKLVSVEAIDGGQFNHYIDLQGKIDAKNTAYVAPRGMGGVVRALYVKKGDRVRKGQVVVKLDDAVARQQVTAAQQQAAVVRSQLNLAKTALERQQNLWQNNIGTEMQVLQSKTQVQTLTSQLAAAEAQARAAREQLDFSSVRADIGGIVDQVNVRVGEQFTGMSASGPQISIVNTSVLKVLVNVPETYLERVKLGTPVVVTLPDAGNKTFNTKVSVVSKLIDPNSRSFYVEASVPSGSEFRANQIAKVQIQDYSTQNAITVPVNTLQTDQQGKYVFVAVTENKRLVARKKRVTVGELYGEKLEITSGLSGGDQIITQGFEDLYDGQNITTVAPK